jgi:dolichol-phosphate mannosyltransferase
MHVPEQSPRGTALMVVPTYQEAENIEALIERLEPVRDLVPLNVLVVDDRSPDGTAAIIRRLQGTRPWLHLMERDGPRGLGAAYRAGFHWGMASGYRYLGEMDADLSHDPDHIPALFAAVVEGADLALGSRYVPGGATEGWPLQRRVLSRGANLFARSLLRLRVRDVTGGYRLYRRGAVRLLLEGTTECAGYGFQVEAVHAIARAGLQILEVPILFRDRRYGESKMSMRTAREAAKRCIALAFTGSSSAPDRHLEPTTNSGVIR